MKVLGLTGWSGSGKTTLLVKLVPEFIARGWSVSTVKHAHHGFDLDQPGKDFWRHRQAGATEVMIVSSIRWALMHELHGDEPPLADLLLRLAAVDLVLVEGFKALVAPENRSAPARSRPSGAVARPQRHRRGGDRPPPAVLREGGVAAERSAGDCRMGVRLPI